jgi:hypothetical protein
MHRKGGFVEIALELEAGLAHKFFILRLMLAEGLFAETGKSADGFQVEVNNGVGTGKKAGRFRCGSLSKVDRKADGGDN